VSAGLIILGAGGGAFDTLDILDALAVRGENWELLGFLDDVAEPGSEFAGRPVLGKIEDAGRFPDSFFINVIGSDRSYRARADLLARTGLDRDRFATLVHPGACVSRHARLGRGVTVAYGAAVAGGVTVGDQVTICPGVIIGHDTRIGDHSMLAPGAVISGFVTVGANAYVGARSVVKQRLTVGEGALVGMGAVVTRDVPPGACVVGCPARERAR
jgi:sugar O-acyltransferase (sialic acid O-acetyltransferase NeuD family)